MTGRVLRCYSIVNVSIKHFRRSDGIDQTWRAKYWILVKSLKVKVTLVQALRLCTGSTAYRGSRRIVLLILDHGTRRGWEVSVTLRPHFTPGKTRYPLYRRLGGPQGRSGQVRKIWPPTGIWSLDRPARSQSLYRLRYPAHWIFDVSVFLSCLFHRQNVSFMCPTVLSPVTCVDVPYLPTLCAPQCCHL
jgi:hypothetical protein